MQMHDHSIQLHIYNYRFWLNSTSFFKQGETILIYKGYSQNENFCWKYRQGQKYGCFAPKTNSKMDYYEVWYDAN